MVDIETLSTQPNAMMLSIGACRIDFRTSDIGYTFYRTIDHKSYAKLDHHIDPSTVLWWMEQSDDARKAVYFDTGSREPVTDVLFTLRSWLGSLLHIEGGADKLCVWGNGAGFDNVVLNHFSKQCGVDMPCNFRGDRCFRTIKSVFPDVIDPPDEPIKHHALYDAVWQAKKLILINNAKNLGFEVGDK